MNIIDLDNQRLPEIYIKNGKECYLDCVRNRLVYITPEETVRQHVLSYLVDELDVPKKAIRVEEHLSHYGINSRRRADIIIEGYKEETDYWYPLAVIECKAPQVAITEKVLMQMDDYAALIGAEYQASTNGYQMECFRYSEEKQEYEYLAGLPTYKDMLSGIFEPVPDPPQFERLTLSEIVEEDKWEEYLGVAIGNDTPVHLARMAGNLWDGLLYSDHKMPVKDYGLFRLIEDYGIRKLEYGNASGGLFAGPYHSYLVDYNGSTEFVSLGLSTYSTWAHQDIAKTSLNVAIDNEKSSHHSLQLVLDDNIAVSKNKYTFYHHGRIAIGNIGCGSVSELRMFIADKYPDIIDGKRFNLGTLCNDHLFNIDEDDMLTLVTNLISYALIRDEYREFRKNNSK